MIVGGSGGMAAAVIEGDRPPYRISFDGGQVIARAIVIASGATYRKLGLDSESKYEGKGIQYAARFSGRPR